MKIARVRKEPDSSPERTQRLIPQKYGTTKKYSEKRTEMTYRPAIKPVKLRFQARKIDEDGIFSQEVTINDWYAGNINRHPDQTEWFLSPCLQALLDTEDISFASLKQARNAVQEKVDDGQHMYYPHMMEMRE